MVLTDSVILIFSRYVFLTLVLLGATAVALTDMYRKFTYLAFFSRRVVISQVIKSRYLLSHPEITGEEADLLSAESLLPALQEEAAADAMVRMAQEHPGKFDILAIGPLTNVARAIEIDPLFPTRIRSLVWMGGEIADGEPIEFNSACDGLAVRNVFTQWPNYKLTMVPFKLTANSAVKWDFYDHLTRYGQSFFSVFLKASTAAYEVYSRGTFVDFKGDYILQSLRNMANASENELHRKAGCLSPRHYLDSDETGATEQYIKALEAAKEEGKEESLFSPCDFYAFLTLVFPWTVKELVSQRIEAVGELGPQHGALLATDPESDTEESNASRNSSVQYVVAEMHLDKVMDVLHWLCRTPEMKSELFLQ